MSVTDATPQAHDPKPRASPTPSFSAQTEPPSGTGVLFALMIAGYPIAWALGFAAMIFPFAALLMVVWLIRYRPVQAPPGSILFAMFLLLVAASFVQVNSVGRMALWLMRSMWYVSAFIAFIYLARQTSPRARLIVVRSMIILWICTIAGGYAALLSPDLTWATPVSIVLPGSITSDAFISDLIQPRTAEVQTFWTGIRLNRPAAPYPYTNAWGSSVALLTPFMLAAVQDRRIGLPRWLGVLMLAAGVVPFYFALNRGAWLTLAIGLGFAALRSTFVNRQPLPLLIVTLAAGLGLVLAAATGIADTAINQLETRSAASNQTRANIYLETIEYSAGSPFIGFGTPRTNPSNPDGPPLGTHGQVWAVMLAHGYLALALYIGFFGYGFLSGRGLDTIGHWAKVSLLIGLLQMPIYGHLPTQIFVMVGAMTMAAWPRDALGLAPRR